MEGFRLDWPSRDICTKHNAYAIIYSMRKNKNNKFSICVVAIVTCMFGLGVTRVATAISATEACNRSEACRAAKEKEQQANKNAAKAASTANAYQNKVNELNAEIASKEAEIAVTKARIGELEKEIAKKEIELENEQDALAELLVNMHFESDAEPIRVLAGASSISDLAEKAARGEVAQEQISAAAVKIKDAKEILELDKSEVENLLASQEQTKQELDKKQAEQQALVAKYESRADQYEADAAAAREERIAAQNEYMRTHQDEYISSGTNAYAGAYNSYPWQGDCPGRQDSYVTYWDGYKIGGYVCECVSYAGWKAYETYGVATAWGNAYSWDDGARKAGYTVDNNPTARTIGQTDSGYYGHVFWVESVNADGSINVTEYNNYYSTGLLTGSYHVGDFGARVIPASEAKGYNYIHF